MSIALVLATPDRVVAASDSRAFDKAHDPPRMVDDVKKIDVNGHYLFAATGLGDLALNAWRATPPSAGESAPRLASRILGTMRAGLTTATHPCDVLFGVFAFAGRAVAAHAIKIRVKEAQADVVQTGAPTAVPFAMILGWDDQPDKTGYVQREIMPTLGAAPTEATMRTLAITTIQRATVQSPKVGGPIHLAIVDGAGARWM